MYFKLLMFHNFSTKEREIKAQYTKQIALKNVIVFLHYFKDTKKNNTTNK